MIDTEAPSHRLRRRDTDALTVDALRRRNGYPSMAQWIASPSCARADGRGHGFHLRVVDGSELYCVHVSVARGPEGAIVDTVKLEINPVQPVTTVPTLTMDVPYQWEPRIGGDISGIPFATDMAKADFGVEAAPANPPLIPAARGTTWSTANFKDIPALDSPPIQRIVAIRDFEARPPWTDEGETPAPSNEQPRSWTPRSGYGGIAESSPH